MRHNGRVALFNASVIWKRHCFRIAVDLLGAMSEAGSVGDSISHSIDVVDISIGGSVACPVGDAVGGSNAAFFGEE